MLAGKTVLLTGASKGIGAATAARLGQAGARLIAHYATDHAGAEAATQAIPSDRRLLVQADLSTPGAAASLWATAVAWAGHVDVLINNAAVMPETSVDLDDESWDDAWHDVWQVNVKAPADLIRAALLHFRQRGGGVLITVSSLAAQRGSSHPDLLAYSATKGAIQALTHTVARNHGAQNVLTYIVAPGTVQTQLSQAAAQSRGGVDAVTRELPMGEFVPPEEVAELMAFLASGECRHLSGATLDVNGASHVR